MASIVKRSKSYSVVYYIKNEKGETKQKWETYSTLEDALNRKEQVESPIPIVGLIKQIRIIGDLADEYIELYGKTRWSCRTYAANLALMRTYILPHMGKVKISQATPRAMQHYYKQLTQLPARKSQYKYDSHGLLSQSTIFEINKLLRNMFNQAVIWDVLSESPVKLLTVKQPKDHQKKILTPQQVIVALSTCSNDLLSIAIKLAYICSLRKGELLGLCWEDIDFEGKCIYINRELACVTQESLDALGMKDVQYVYEPRCSTNKTRLVLKPRKQNLRSVWFSSLSPWLII